MAENNINAIVPDIYEALDVVSRELVGMIPAVHVNASAERAGLNQNIVVDIEPEGNVSDITPAMSVPEPTGQTSGSATITISKSRAAEFGFVGEDQKKLNTGVGFQTVYGNKIAQAIRKLTNEVESDLCGLYTTFSRAAGAAGTVPFATAGNYMDSANAMKILKDNGAPVSDNHLILNTTAGANIVGKQAEVNREGSDAILRQGILLDKSGLALRESAQVVEATAGTGAGYLVNNVAGYAVGDTAIEVDTGAGTISGDVVTFAGDSNQYVGTLSGTTLTLNGTGLRETLADGVAVTVVAGGARNMAFNRSAIILVARPPARPAEGDLALDVMEITDPRSGLTFEFSMYAGYRKVRYEVALAWGQKNIKSAHTALLID